MNEVQLPTSTAKREVLFQRLAFLAGPLLFFLILVWLHPASMSPEAVKVMAVTAWIATWWITEAVPLPVTSLIPIVLFPLLGVMKIDVATTAYGHPLVFLYIGGFLLAIAIEKTGLHERIALSIIRRMGTKLNMIVLGFMLATGFLSMWISNTATAVMMLPIGLAILTVVSTDAGEYFSKFSKALMLAIAYAASIGGVATLIGTPPNVVFAGVVKDTLQTEVTFMQWFSVGFPFALLLLIFAWWYLTHVAFPLHKASLSAKDSTMADRMTARRPMSANEIKVSVVFVLMAVAWITRSFVLQKFIPGLDDTIIAMVGGIALFLIPSGKASLKGILNWDDAIRLPWGIILLFGGGLALAEAFESSGLDIWIGDSLKGYSMLGRFLIILLIVAIVNFLTEFTSNLATVTMILPILAPIAIASGVEPLTLMTAATFAASCGFMMPAGTPPNAIAFGSGYLKIGDMIKTGLILNLVSIVAISLVMYFLLERVWI
jgi:sodium-dependent dicarboxylate transporter 2/3/5